MIYMKGILSTRIFRHAVRMVIKTFRGYALLSVTIFFSFSLLFGFLAYVDTSQYNAYKETFSHRRGDVIILDDGTQGPAVRQTLFDNLEKMENTVYYTAYLGGLGHDNAYYDGTAIGMQQSNFYMTNMGAFFLPDHAWLDGMSEILKDYYTSTEVVWNDDKQREHFELAADEVILSEKVFFSLGYDNREDMTYYLRTRIGITLALKVVGYIRSSIDVDYSPDGWKLSTPPMLLSTKLYETVNLVGSGTRLHNQNQVIQASYLVVYSEKPERVVQLLGNLRYFKYIAWYQEQDAATLLIRNELRNKVIIVCALLFLLGINLYSCFSNALERRKYEIGVKRALGASGWSIVRQFFYESLVVMIANILLSVAVVTDILIVYKYLVESGIVHNVFEGTDNIVIYISAYSAMMFALCASVLTIAFSLIFAYRATKVEIVKYLKAE